MSQLASSILMIRPASFGFNNQTAVNNLFQNNPESGKADAIDISLKAREQFDQFVHILENNLIDLTVIEDSPLPVKPDAVFPNNWFCTLSNGKVIVFPMYASNRREEKRDDLLHLLNDKFQIDDIEDWSEFEADNFFLEGTGSMVMDHVHKIIYACLSERTHPALLKRFAQTHGYHVLSFHANDQNDHPIYHTNVMMHIGDTYAVVCLESIKDASERILINQRLTECGHEVIEISLDQVNHFAGNMIQVLNKKGVKLTILSKDAFNCLSDQQKTILSIHTKLLPVDISVIEKVGGGSARCMVAEIFLNRK